MLRQVFWILLISCMAQAEDRSAQITRLRTLRQQFEPVPAKEYGLGVGSYYNRHLLDLVASTDQVIQHLEDEPNLVNEVDLEIDLFPVLEAHLNLYQQLQKDLESLKPDASHYRLPTYISMAGTTIPPDRMLRLEAAETLRQTFVFLYGDILLFRRSLYPAPVDPETGRLGNLFQERSLLQLGDGSLRLPQYLMAQAHRFEARLAKWGNEAAQFVKDLNRMTSGVDAAEQVSTHRTLKDQARRLQWALGLTNCRVRDVPYYLEEFKKTDAKNVASVQLQIDHLAAGYRTALQEVERAFGILASKDQQAYEMYSPRQNGIWISDPLKDLQTLVSGSSMSLRDRHVPAWAIAQPKLVVEAYQQALTIPYLVAAGNLIGKLDSARETRGNPLQRGFALSRRGWAAWSGKTPEVSNEVPTAHTFTGAPIPRRSDFLSSSVRKQQMKVEDELWQRFFFLVDWNGDGFPRECRTDLAAAGDETLALAGSGVF